MGKKKLSIYLLFHCFTFPLLAQNISFPNPVNRDSTIQWISPFSRHFFQGSFQEKTKAVSPVLNGKEYNPFPDIITDGTLFYQSEDWTSGDITYGGYTYKNLLLKYDEFQDVLISPYEKYDKILQFLPDFLTGFHIYDKTFVQFLAPNTKDSLAYGIKSGIYEVLYPGKTKIWVKRSKRIDRTLVSGKVENIPISYNRYFLFREDHFEEFSSLHSFLNLESGLKSKLERYISKEKIRYKKNPETSMVLLARVIDSYTN